MLPFLAIMLPTLVILSAFILNLSYIELARTELQISADAASRAGGKILASTGDANLAIEKARELALLNSVAGEPLKLNDSDIEFGQATRSGTANRYEFNVSSNPFNAMRVNANRSSGSANGPIQMLIPNVLTTSEVSMAAVSTSTQVELDIAIVIDRSGSMAYADNEDSNTFDNPAAAPPGWIFGDQVPNPSRWIDAENAVVAFLNTLTDSPQEEMVSLVTYGDNPALDVPLTEFYSDITNGMSARGSSFAEGLTNIGGGIEVGNTSLQSDPNNRGFATKVILVLTDGIHNTGTSPEVAARAAIQDDVTIFTVTFSTEANQSRMRNVAQIGKGKHFHANSAAELTQAFEEIAQSLPTLIIE